MTLVHLSLFVPQRLVKAPPQRVILRLELQRVLLLSHEVLPDGAQLRLHALEFDHRATLVERNLRLLLLLRQLSLQVGDLRLRLGLRAVPRGLHALEGDGLLAELASGVLVDFLEVVILLR